MVNELTTNSVPLSLLISTAVLVGLVSIALYVFVIRPTLPSTRAAVHQTMAAHTTTTTTTSSTARIDPATAASHVKEQVKCCRVPPHVSGASAQIAVNGGSNLLIDGLVAFKHCRASLPSSSSLLSDDEIRKTRAKLFSNLLEGSAVSAPPAKGSAIVVAIPVESVTCDRQRMVLYLLATYYNLLVILTVTVQAEEKHVSFTEQDRVNAIATLRGGSGDDTQLPVLGVGLSSETLPDHRIAISSAVTGRVAFVRQLQRIELVLDFDPEVLALLTRFGHRVIIYEGASSSTDLSISGLGKAML